MSETKSIFLSMVSVVAFVLILLVIGFLFNLLILKVSSSSPNRFFFFSRVGKSIACHSPAKWCHCGVFLLTFEGVGVMRTFLWCTQEDS